MINIITILFLYSLVFVGSEISYRKFNVSFLVSRKMAHIAGSMVSFFLPYYISNISVAGIGLFFTIIIFVSKKNFIFKGIHDKGGVSIGEVVFPLGIVASALIVWPLSIIAYQGSCLVLGLSDGLAGYFGNKYGKKSYSALGGVKTVEGSVVFFFLTVVIFLVYALVYTNEISIFRIVLLSFSALIITLVEAMLSRGWDNLIIPITAGLALLWGVL